jgi:hypothetical protein
MKKIIVLAIGFAGLLAVSGCHQTTRHNRRHHDIHPHAVLPHQQGPSSLVDRSG